ncbi:MAG: magnesium transporter [Planctomycetota bacterium]|nr:magnesium transporter [Planctomycetota bacterium]MDA1105450.1 magnesium transporter [Planctomycetota bacterium]
MSLEQPTPKDETAYDAETGLTLQLDIDNPSIPTAADRRATELVQHTIDAAALADAVEQQEPADAADTLHLLAPREATEVVSEMEADAAAEALVHMEVPLARSILEDLIEESPDIAGRLLEEMAPDDATDLLQQLPARERDRLLASMSASGARRLRELMVYPPETAGGLMTTAYLALRDHMSIAEASDWIRAHAVADWQESLWVVDRKGRLVGNVPLRRILLARDTDRVGDLATKELDAVPPDMDREEVARHFEKYDYLSLPVVDPEQRLLGVVTVDDVIDIIRAEGTEDAQRMVGAGSNEAVWSTVAEKLRGRFPWLIVNLFTSAIAAMVVLAFDGLIAQIALLAVIMPVIANQSGNAGQQSLAVTLRALVLGHVRPKRAMAHVTREMMVGAVNGTICGILVGGTVAVLQVTTGGQWHLGIVIAVSMTLTLTIGCLWGASLPIMMDRLGFDPATASTIFLTMVTDSLSFFVFLGLSSLFAHWILPGT